MVDDPPLALNYPQATPLPLITRVQKGPILRIFVRGKMGNQEEAMGVRRMERKTGWTRTIIQPAQGKDQHSPYRADQQVKKPSHGLAVGNTVPKCFRRCVCLAHGGSALLHQQSRKWVGDVKNSEEGL